MCCLCFAIRITVIRVYFCNFIRFPMGGILIQVPYVMIKLSFKSTPAREWITIAAFLKGRMYMTKLDLSKHYRELSEFFGEEHFQPFLIVHTPRSFQCHITLHIFDTMPYVGTHISKRNEQNFSYSIQSQAILLTKTSEYFCLYICTSVALLPVYWCGTNWAYVLQFPALV